MERLKERFMRWMKTKNKRERFCAGDRVIAVKPALLGNIDNVIGVAGTVLYAYYCKNWIYGDIPAILVVFDKPVGGHSDCGCRLWCEYNILQKI